MTIVTPDAADVRAAIDPVRTLLLAAAVCAAAAFSPEPGGQPAASASAGPAVARPELVGQQALATPLGEDVHPHL